jgi:hypothetical protein
MAGVTYEDAGHSVHMDFSERMAQQFHQSSASHVHGERPQAKAAS